MARVLVVLALPHIAKNRVQVADLVVDGFWLGRPSEDAVAGVGLVIQRLGVHAVFWAVTLSNIAAAVGTGWYYQWAADGGMLERAATEAVE